MENKKIQMGIIGFVLALVFVFFVGAAAAGGLVYLMTGNKEVIREVKVYENDEQQNYINHIENNNTVSFSYNAKLLEQVKVIPSENDELSATLNYLKNDG